MTWKERRTITILSSILLILVIALLIVLGVRYRQSRETPADSTEASGDALLTDDDEYTSLSYYNGSATLSFSLDETGKWIWSDDPGFPLDDATVTAILSELSSLTPQQTITDGDTLESYGLADNPTATLDAATKEGKTLRLLLGNTTTDGDSYYMLMNDQESPVYIIADTLYTHMQTPIYDMMLLPEFPELTEDVIQSITIQGAASEDGTSGSITVLTAQHTGDTTTWRYSGANVTDAPTVKALLEDISSLAMDKCVDYHPSEEAADICGFTSPDAVLTVAYRPAGAETDQFMKLTIGTTALDGSGRYVRLEDDSTIYLLPTASLDPLMRVSVNGLEG